MSDQPPPKKKSRLLLDGRGLLGSIFHRSGATNDNTGIEQGQKKKGKGKDTSHNSSRPSRLEIDSTNPKTPPLGIDNEATRVTPTAAAFQELSFEERSNRPKAVYGTHDLRKIVQPGHANYDETTAPATIGKPLPWTDSPAESSHNRKSSLLDASVDAIKQSPFTFRAPLQPAPIYRQTSQGSTTRNVSQGYTTQGTPQSTVNTPLIRTPDLSPLKVRKQRTELPPIPESPNKPAFPAVTGAHTSPITQSQPKQDSASTVDFIPQTSAHRKLILSESVSATKLARRKEKAPGPAEVPRSSPEVADNAFTSPGRLKRAISFAIQDRKRKRGAVEMPAPAYVYQRTNSPTFNIFQGILLYPELCFQLATHLPVDDLISLYAISQDFHTILNTRVTTVIVSQALKKAPFSSHIFPFRSYGQLCRKDPAARLAHPDPKKAALGAVRSVPSFRWLKMLIYREKTVHAIMTLFAERGIPLPRRCEQSLKKIWFIMDIPDNARRIGYVHNLKLINDLDLYFAVCFFVKLDMLFTDPTAPAKRVEGRRLILSQPSLTKLLQLLKGEALSTRWELMKAWVELKYDPPADDVVEETETMFGVPRADWGRMRKEFWGRKRDKDGKLIPVKNLTLLLRPDQLLIREATRRGLKFAGHYIRFLLYGYVHPQSMDDFEPREMERWIREYDEDDYDVEDMVVGTQALAVSDGGDPYLDLGARRGPSHSIQSSVVTRKERDYRESENAFIDGLYAASERERRDMGLL